jgi:fatty-acyl-CoA synthase
MPRSIATSTAPPLARQVLGPASGARIAVLSRNCAEMLVLQLASIRAGAVFVPLNWRLAPAELEALVADAEPALLFADEGFAQDCGRDSPAVRPSIPSSVLPGW